MTKMQELQEQAARAERLASSILDTVTIERLRAFAADCRRELGVLSDPEGALHCPNEEPDRHKSRYDISGHP
jgi:hypothetical protein